MPRRKKEEVQHDFVNGWGIPIHLGRILHVLPYPLDLGSQGEALCGRTAVHDTGWEEIPEDEPPLYQYRCTTCVNLYRVMYDENNPLLTDNDRQKYEALVDEYNSRAEAVL